MSKRKQYVQVVIGLTINVDSEYENVEDVISSMTYAFDSNTHSTIDEAELESYNILSKESF